MKKIMALAMALMLVLSLCTAAHAEKTVTVKVDATKYLNDKDPGKEKFAFMVWALTAEQMKELELKLPPDDPGDIEEGEIIVVPQPQPPREEIEPEMGWPGGSVAGPDLAPDPDDGLVDPSLGVIEDPWAKLTEEEIKGIADDLRKQLMKLPYTIVYNDGTKIPFIDETYTVDDCGEKYFIIAEVQDPSKPFIYDDSIYLYCVEIFELWHVIEEGNINSSQGGSTLEIEHLAMACISPKHGIHENVVSDSEKPEDHFIFNNYVNNEVPVTGDETNFVLLAALAVVSMVGMTAIIRKKNEA